MRYACLALLILDLPSVTHADDAPWNGVGGAGTFVKNDQIKMVSELVDIRIDNDRMNVQADFVFKNDGHATMVTMAFPDDLMSFVNRRALGSIVSLRSWVDGKAMSVDRKVLKTQGNYWYHAIWRKDVYFSNDQTRRVRIRYSARHGEREDYRVDRYILTTGAFWKGPIEDCVVKIDWSALRGTSRLTLSKSHAPRYTFAEVPTPLTARSITLRYKNLEPDFNLEMEWSPGFWNFVVNGKISEGSARDFDDGWLRLLGGGSDPLVHEQSLSEVFSSVSLPDFRFSGSRTLEVRGKKKLLSRLFVRRAGKSGEAPGRYVYLRDVVKALGGTYRYSSHHDQATIRFPYLL